MTARNAALTMATNPTTDLNAPSRRDCANALRALAMDAVQQAKSGHPGMPMGMADIAEVLWKDYLCHNPANPGWPDRDRFVLSNGHGSMLLYSLLHLSGYPLPMEELRNFRQFGAKTPGHPEYDPEIGVETTTGPLGQGLSNGVGMALAEKTLAATFNRPGYPVVDHYTYVFLGDGCLMEGVSHEACSLAGTWQLGKLICLYDDNEISIDGDVKGWFADDTPARFAAYGWHVVADVDGHDPDAISAAIEAARADDRPSLICCKTVIGKGAPNKQGTASTHGSPLGDDEIAAAREVLGWSSAPFEVPAQIRQAWDATAAGEASEAEWQELMAGYRAEHPEMAGELERRLAGQLPEDWDTFADEALAAIAAEPSAEATRKSSLRALNAFAPALPELFGGSADLTGSNLTLHDRSVVLTPGEPAGNYLHFGVREFGMTGVLNGVALHGGYIPYGGTFLVFSDYARNALRLAALMGVRQIAVLTHDSIGLGEDGPTHQPVEHVASLQLMPNMRVWRPCDAFETAVAWRDAIEHQAGPTSLVLTRQGVPAQARDSQQRADVSRGAYVLHGSGMPDVILLASGSEVHIAVEAARQLEAEGHATRVVSMPCMKRFLEQSDDYRESVLPASVTRRIAVEAGSPHLWHRFTGPAGRIVGLDRFGESAPAEELFEHFGFTPDNIAGLARELLSE
jgi:transketolase